MNSTLLPVAILLSVFALPGNATLVGSSVNGSLTFAADPSNYFDPRYGFVPAVYLNASGATVTISDTALEFGFDDGSSRISANFSGSHLTISDLIEISGPTNSFRMIFTDTAFAGQYLIPISDTFPLGDYSVLGEVMTLNYPGGNPSVGQTLIASFTVAPVPEPSTLNSVSISILAAIAFFFVREARNPR